MHTPDNDVGYVQPVLIMPTIQITDVHAPNNDVGCVQPVPIQPTIQITDVQKPVAAKLTATACELCCGSAGWAAALRTEGVEAIGIDYERNPQKPKAPIVLANIATESGQQQFYELDSELSFDVVHAGPPCGTGSRARERALPMSAVRAGIKRPMPLRSNQSPEGIEGLSDHDRMKVELANAIYKFVLSLFIARHKAGRLFSLENPTNAYIWQFRLAIELMSLEGVTVNDFDQCLHGGARPVRRRWVSNIPGMKSLRGHCPGISPWHFHLPFTITKIAGKTHFSTAEEATYPTVLCRKTAKLAVSELVRRKTILVPTSMPEVTHEPIPKRLCVRASGGRFVRGNKLPPLISEFHETKELNVPATSQTGQVLTALDGIKMKILRLTGVVSGEFIGAVVGVYRSPKQFVDKAWSARHPIDLPSYVPEILVRNIFWLLTTPALEVKAFRLKAIQDLRTKAAELREPNDKIHASLSEDSSRVLQGKHFTLMQWALDQADYGDKNVVQANIEGTPLTGTVQQSSVFPTRIKPASMTSQALLSASPFTRKPIIQGIRSSGDHEIDSAVWEETQSEIQKGWLSKPHDEASLTLILGKYFTVARRFGIRQSGKIRTIDDYSEPGVNSTVTSTERIDLLGTDELFILMKTVASSVHEDGTVVIYLPDGVVLRGKLPPGVTPSQAREWLGKAYDLESAYRQQATSDKADNKKFCVIGVYNPETKSSNLFIQYAAPFGSISSVYYFNRAARALWAIGAYALRLVWTNYFDDYPTVNPASSSSECDISVKSLFTILGWNLSKNEKKTKPFHSEFDTLGVVADMTQLPTGTAIFSNKPARVREIGDAILDMVSKRRCPQPLMASIRGRSQYSSAQVFGRMAIGPLHVMSQHEYHSKSGILEAPTIKALLDIKLILETSPPRNLSCHGERRPLLLFTDGAVEGIDHDKVTCGSVLIDTAIDWAEMWGGIVPRSIVKAWKRDGGKVQVIGQAELLPVALSRRVWKEHLRHRRLIVFIDNDSARQGLIRGWSASNSSLAIISDMLQSEILDQTWIWYARVPTHSNPADDPSRLILVPSEANDFAQVIPMPQIPSALFPN